MQVFFSALVACFAVKRKEYNFTVKLKTCQCILFPNFHWNYILFQISTLGLNMSYSEMSPKTRMVENNKQIINI